MKPKYYTKTGQHPDDAINRVKTFINELQKVQDKYFDDLVDDLNISKELNDWLFDYIFNEDSDIDLMFTEYLEDVNKKYEDFVKKD
jgi:hemerythrin